MAKSMEVDTEIKTKLSVSQRISLTFMLTTALIVLGSFFVAAAYTMALNIWGKESKTVVENENTDTTTVRPLNNIQGASDDHSFSTQ